LWINVARNREKSLNHPTFVLKLYWVMSIGLSQVHKCRAFLHANRVGQKATQSAESSAHFWHLAQVSESVICEKKFRTEIWSVCPVVWNIRRSRLTKSKLPYPVKNRAPIEDRSSTVIFWDEKLYCAYVPRLRERESIFQIKSIKQFKHKMVKYNGMLCQSGQTPIKVGDQWQWHDYIRVVELCRVEVRRTAKRRCSHITLSTRVTWVNGPDCRLATSRRSIWRTVQTSARRRHWLDRVSMADIRTLTTAIAVSVRTASTARTATNSPNQLTVSWHFY